MWASIVAETPDLGARDLALLEQACAQADMVASLAGVVAKFGHASAHAGRPSPAVGELRQARLALSRLLGSVKLPRAGSGSSSASERAKHAAGVRWGHESEAAAGQHPTM